MSEADGIYRHLTDGRKLEIVKMKKKKIILACIAVVLIGVIGWGYWVVSVNSKVFDDIYTEYTSSQVNGKNAILIYQPSRTSFSEVVATDIAKGLNDSGYNVTLTTANDKLTKDLSKYQIIVFGTPIYTGQYSSTIKEYVKSIKNYGEAEIFFYCIGMLEGTGELESMKNLFKGQNLVEAVKISKSKCVEDKEYAYKYGCQIGTK